jgi:non-ribosomal peptide synthase protein (TIGR01720 family)
MVLACLECRQHLNYKSLSLAIRAVSEQHQAFRFGLRWYGENWGGIIGGTPKVAVEKQSMGSLTHAEEAQLLASLESDLPRALAMPSELIAKFIYVDRGAVRPPLLWIAFNHLVCDHHSIVVLLGQIEQAYWKIEHGVEAHFDTMSSSLKEWTEGLHRLAYSPTIESDRDYWLASSPQSAQQIEIDNPDGTNEQGSADSVVIVLNRDVTRNLSINASFAESADRGMLILMVTALGLAYREWTGHDALYSYVLNRGRSKSLHEFDLLQTIGCTFHSFPLLVSLKTPHQYLTADLVAETQSVMEAVPRRGLSYNLLRYLRPESLVSRELSSLPQPEIVFSFRGSIGSNHSSIFGPLRRDLSGVRSEPTRQRRELLQVDGVIAEGSLVTTFAYSDTLRRESVERLSLIYQDKLSRAQSI